jgi:hypothetical protein
MGCVVRLMTLARRSQIYTRDPMGTASYRRKNDSEKQIKNLKKPKKLKSAKPLRGSFQPQPTPHH